MFNYRADPQESPDRIGATLAPPAQFFRDGEQIRIQIDGDAYTVVHRCRAPYLGLFGFHELHHNKTFRAGQYFIDGPSNFVYYKGINKGALKMRYLTWLLLFPWSAFPMDIQKGAPTADEVSAVAPSPVTTATASPIPKLDRPDSPPNTVCIEPDGKDIHYHLAGKCREAVDSIELIPAYAEFRGYEPCPKCLPGFVNTGTYAQPEDGYGEGSGGGLGVAREFLMALLHKRPVAGLLHPRASPLAVVHDDITAFRLIADGSIQCGTFRGDVVTVEIQALSGSGIARWYRRCVVVDGENSKVLNYWGSDHPGDPYGLYRRATLTQALAAKYGGVEAQSMLRSGVDEKDMVLPEDALGVVGVQQ